MDYRICRDVNSEFLWNSEKELEEFGSEIDYYLSDNLSEDKSFIEEALVQGRVFIEDGMEEKEIIYFELKTINKDLIERK